MNHPNNSKQNKINKFNPDSVGLTSANIFGLPFTVEESDVVVIPVPWDVTVSNREGTSAGPLNVYNESPQIDLSDEYTKDPWKAGIAMEDFPADILIRNNQFREKAKKYIEFYESNGSVKGFPDWEGVRDEINEACEDLHELIRRKSLNYINQGKLPVILGGDHSTPLGLIKALAKTNTAFGILQIDAHADLHPAFEGFKYSHASIMYNALSLDQVKNITQVGVRDYCGQELELIQAEKTRISTYFARDLHYALLEGESWKEITQKIIHQLPDKVYISLDVDGLEPALCSSTGTPVPGGLSYYQVLYLIEKMVDSGRTIIGFDLVETGPDKMDGIVSCRLLYKIISMMLKSNHRL